jgi:hypothetical protein
MFFSLYQVSELHESILVATLSAGYETPYPPPGYNAPKHPRGYEAPPRICLGSHALYYSISLVTIFLL